MNSITAQKQEKPLCNYCGKQLYGREGKKYCNVDCKNNFNSRIRSELRNRENEFFPKAFAQIKINYRILLGYNLDQLEEDQIIYITRDELRNQGFDTRYCTTAFAGHHGKIWKCCFDHLWSEDRSKLISLKYDKYAYTRHA